jgi:hypothetical protein
MKHFILMIQAALSVLASAQPSAHAQTSLAMHSAMMNFAYQLGCASRALKTCVGCDDSIKLQELKQSIHPANSPDDKHWKEIRDANGESYSNPDVCTAARRLPL